MHQKINVLDRLRWWRPTHLACGAGMRWWHRAITQVTSYQPTRLLVRIDATGTAARAAAQRYGLAMLDGVKKIPHFLSGSDEAYRPVARGWIGVDLDGTLAKYHGWKGIRHIGPPVPAMLERVKGWVREGVEVRIFTARVSHRAQRRIAVQTIGDWCQRHGLPRLQVTNVKDFQMIELWDDRAVRVEINVGRRTDEQTPRERQRRQGKRASSRSATPVAHSSASRDDLAASPPPA